MKKAQNMMLFTLPLELGLVVAGEDLHYLKHKLDYGDAIVFELVEAERFKVYIVGAFENIDKKEEKEESDVLVEDENMHTSKV